MVLPVDVRQWFEAVLGSHRIQLCVIVVVVTGRCALPTAGISHTRYAVRAVLFGRLLFDPVLDHRFLTVK